MCVVRRQSTVFKIRTAWTTTLPRAQKYHALLDTDRAPRAAIPRPGKEFTIHGTFWRTWILTGQPGRGRAGLERVTHIFERMPDRFRKQITVGCCNQLCGGGIHGTCLCNEVAVMDSPND